MPCDVAPGARHQSLERGEGTAPIPERQSRCEMRHGPHSVVGPDSIAPPGRKFAPSSAVTSPNRPRQPHGEPVAHERPDLGGLAPDDRTATEMPGSVTPRSYRG